MTPHLEAEGKARHRPVSPVEEPAYRVFLLGPDPAPDEKRHEHGRQGHRKERREEHGEGLRVREGLEKPSRLPLEGKDREKADGDDEKGEEEGRTYFFRRLYYHVGPASRACPASSHSSSFLWAFSTMMMDASTMAPMAMAMPARLMMLEVTPR